MKKLLLLFVALVAGVMSAYAQNELQCATLQHGENMTVYIGTGGFASAYEAAVDGDVITLSAGEFSMPANGYIYKAISIYGAGFEDNEETSTQVTKLGRMFITLVSDVYGYNSLNLTGLHLEGIYFSDNIEIRGNNNAIEKLKDFTLKKCYVSGTIYNSIDTIENAVIDQCVLMGNGLHDGYSAGESDWKVVKSMLFTHSYITGIIGGYNSELSFIWVDHCISKAEYAMNNQGKKIVWTNSLLLGEPHSGSYAPAGSLSVVKNCIIWKNQFDGSVTLENNYIVPLLSDIFADEASNAYSPTRTFELLQPDTWVGTDGTQVGLHGTTGWSKVPGIPVVKNLQLNVDGSTLNVTYEAEAR